jgi:Family of unknown function (DUF6152)
MSRNLLIVFALAAALLLPAISLFAHHSQSGEFDNSKPLEFTGTVKAVEWTNPHAYIRVEVKDANGKVSAYRVEIMAPNGLYRNGWRRTTVKPGMAVAFKGIQARNPESINVSGRLFVDGKVVFQGQGPGDDSN